jgi:aryl-alcohol dehydrogenase-like predicted oxidoreductase
MHRRNFLRFGAALGGAALTLSGARAGAASAAKSGAAAAGTLELGGTFRVNRLGFGAMRLTGTGIWGEPKDPAEARRILRRAVELGVEFIDTADSYGPAISERLIAEALSPYPRGLVIATKGGITRGGPDQWARDGRPEHLRVACEASLKRLRLDTIDLYQLHAIDPTVPFEDSLGELVLLQKEGKIRLIGVSNFDLAQLEAGRRIAQIVSVQNRYNVVDRSSQGVLDYCTTHRIAFVPWSPLAQSARDATAEKEAGKTMAAIAAARGVSVPQVALAWSLAQSPWMLPIPGTSSMKHMEENVAAGALRLTPEELRSLG